MGVGSATMQLTRLGLAQEPSGSVAVRPTISAINEVAKIPGGAHRHPILRRYNSPRTPAVPELLLLLQLHRQASVLDPDTERPFPQKAV